ncbi:MAG: HD-GYP domain-containing protein (c-di-GMP phosphodiesterase class II) [Phycisphaerales bacterium]|jgi:HD-GYP domain-containing protein (c-di-GMP phosphodiesterase class II)
MNQLAGQFGHPLPPELRRRCDELELPLWRIDMDGHAISEPHETGPLGLWLVSKTVRRCVQDAASVWADQQSPEPIEQAPGLWLIPIPEKVRRRRTGYLLAVEFGPQLIGSETFLEACHDAQLTTSSAEHAIGSHAAITRDEVGRLHRMLGWAVKDLARQERDEQTVQGFTTQLSDAYETIHALYSIGHSISDIASPQKVILEITQRLFETTPFGWVLCRLAADGRMPESLRGKTLAVGNSGLGPEGFGGVMVLFEEACIDSPLSNCLILDQTHAIPTALGTQVAVQPIRRDGEILGLIAAGNKVSHDSQISSYETLLFEAASGYMRSFLDNVLLFHEQRAMFLGTVRAMTAAIDAKDRYTRGHSERVAMLSAMLAKAAGLRPGQCEQIHIAGLVHDVGKIGVSERVLTKPGKLTPEEFEEIKTHPEVGYRILRDIPALRDVLPGVLHHHERWDSRGYPHGVGGDKIPQMARIIALADTFDAMSSNRSYRPAMDRPTVLAEIERCGGTQFDEQLAKVFVGLDFTAYDQRVAEHQAQDIGLTARPDAA